jgi:ABC-2 type transport system permease protein
MNSRRFFTVIWKEFLHILRDPPSIGMSLMMPIIFTIVFGYAVTTDVNHVPMAILDNDHTVESRILSEKFLNADYFVLEAAVNNQHEVERLMDEGKIKAALLIPNGYSQSLQKGVTPDTLLIIDGTDPNIARTALQYGTLISNVYQMTATNGSFQLPQMKTRVWYNPNLESSKFIVPGLIGLIMQNITIMLTAFAMVREKEKGTIEQLMVSPLRPWELVLGKMVPYVLIGSLDFVIALWFGTWLFHVPIQGSLGLLLLLGFGFVICALAIGMLISTKASNQLQAMQIAFLTILPTVLLSGFMFPRESMPKVIYWISNVIPLTYFLNILRGIILKGVDITAIWQDVMWVCVIGSFLLFMAITRYHKRLD